MAVDFAAIKDVLDKQHEALGGFMKRQDGRLEEIIERLELVEAKATGPGLVKPRAERDAGEHRKAFDQWLRKPGDADRQLALRETEAKAVTIASQAGGGYAVPEEIGREIERLEKLFSPVRNLVKVVRVGTSDYKELVNIRGATTGWAGESTDRSTGTDTPSLRERTPSWGELYAYPQASEWSLDDMFFDAGAWLAEEVAQEFAVEEGSAVIDGNGSSKPTGMLNTAPTSAADFASPMRDSDAYQFVASLSTSSPATAEIMPDALIDLVYSVNSAYRARGVWTMNSTTMGAVRKLKDADNNYLWQPGLGGQPDRLLGYRVEPWEQMQDIGTNNHPIAFGDFRRGYVLAEHAAGLKITVDNVTKPGHRKFYIRRREAGIILNNDAIKWLKTTVA